MHGIGGEIKTIPEDFIVEEIPKEKVSKSREHIIFWVEKRNMDTHEVIRLLSKKLRISRKRFGYAGTKDKFAVAKQRFSIWDPDMNIEEKLKKLSFKYLKLYGFERGDRLNLGDLKGNKFTITIRNIALGEEEIKKKLEKTFEEMKKGIPNYFGVQRFGGIRPITHLVGIEMLKGNFEEAVKIYVAKPFDSEHSEVKKIREYLWKNWGDRKAYLTALKKFPKRFRYERSMLDYLYKRPRDFVGALRRIPKKVRKLFINAVQAWIFNRALQRIVEKHGISKIRDIKIPLVGYDTVLKGEIGRIVENVMKEIGISQKDFILRGMPEMKASGGERNAMIRVKDMELKEIFNDEFNKNKNAIKISFSLPSGSYATVVLDILIKH